MPATDIFLVADIRLLAIVPRFILGSSISLTVFLAAVCFYLFCFSASILFSKLSVAACLNLPACQWWLYYQKFVYLE